MRQPTNPSVSSGIITKPDSLIPGSKNEKYFASLAQNMEVEFRLGWHVLKNLDSDKDSFSLTKRNLEEDRYFSKSIWPSLPSHLLGIYNLKPRLSNILMEQISTELPSLVEEIASKLENCHKNLEIMGPRRETRDEQQKYLLEVSMKFQSLIKAAIDGVYNDAFFEHAQSNLGYSQRLRAVIQNTNQQFANHISAYGSHRYIVEFEVEDFDEADADRVPVTRDTFVTHIKTLIFRTRGRELPGTFSPMVVEDLFREQCRPWNKILCGHVEMVADAARKLLSLVCEHIADEKTGQCVLREIVEPAIKRIMKALKLKADELLEPHKYWHPITYNHYLTETLQKIRGERHMAQARKTLASRLGVTEDAMTSTNYPVKANVNLRALLEAVTSLDEPDMDRSAASDALDCLEAYYKVGTIRYPRLLKAEQKLIEKKYRSH